MVFTRPRSKQWLFGILLFFVVFSNFMIYRLPAIPISDESHGVVLGSLIDLAIVAPLLVLALTRKKGFTAKRFITFMVLGLVAARFIIPAQYFEPFTFVPYAAIGLELVIIAAELGLIIMLIKHLPVIVQDVTSGSVESLFAFPAKVKEKVSNHFLVSIIAAELLMFYYAFASWKKVPSVEKYKFYLHRKSSLIAFYIMLIHAIVIETLGLHWWLHDKSAVLSIVLLILNIYAVVYFIGDIQAIRLNPVKVEKDLMRISLGLGKRMEIPYEEIHSVEKVGSSYNAKDKEMIEFIARDFEELKPHFIIHFNQPLKAVMFLGIEKKYKRAAVRLDEPEQFYEILMEKIK